MLSFTSLTVLCCILLSLPCHCLRLLIGHLTYFFILSYFIPFYFPHSIPIPTQIEKPPSLSHPIRSDTVLSYPILSSPISPYPIILYPILSCPISPYSFPSYQTRSSIFLSSPISFYPILSYFSLSFSMISNQILSCPSPHLDLSTQSNLISYQNKVPAVLRLRLDEAIALKRSQVDAASPWAFVAFFRYLAMVQVSYYCSFICLSLCICLYLFIYVCIYEFIYHSIYLFIHRSLYMYASIYLSNCLPMYQFVCFALFYFLLFIFLAFSFSWFVLRFFVLFCFYFY